MPSSPPAAALSLRRLCKSYGGKRVVGPLDVELARGSVTALLGGNGPGKTTTIGMIMGLIKPSAGSIHALGADMATDRESVLGRMNFESPYVDLPHRLTVRQNLRVFALLYGVQDVKGKIARLAEDFALRDFLDRPTGRLSAGQKIRFSLARRSSTIRSSCSSTSPRPRSIPTPRTGCVRASSNNAPSTISRSSSPRTT